MQTILQEKICKICNKFFLVAESAVVNIKTCDTCMENELFDLDHDFDIGGME